ncbi:hypothetical protein TL16_g06214 [Triparma laevis f. inornata]|uniref:Uncharacterized protein n=2 Tax=Triparma laevis TaxID=1534972 RepID=A0A9W7FLS2_9STRA|nr:hypothetical protein TL16_g06214 [Triparma laevis f. inornata]GMI14517.1 hypothetical protein TrLO_g4891 [Triparma laevis f. longispina]
MESYQKLEDDQPSTFATTLADEQLAVSMQKQELDATKVKVESSSTGRSTYSAPKIPQVCSGGSDGSDYGPLGDRDFEMTGAAITSLKDDGKLAKYIQSTMTDSERDDYDLAVKLQELEVDRARVQTQMANRQKVERTKKFARSSLRR